MNVLDRIRTYKLEEIATRKRSRPLAAIEAEARAAAPVRPFRAALQRAQQAGYGLIAEIKKASPSKGLIRADFDPRTLAAAYERGGATCLSVLTDGPSFQGADGYLSTARAETSLPCLRKDFLYDPWQVPESRAIGADCVLLILATLSDGQARELEEAAVAWGMDVLIEVHDRAELDRALALKSPMIGVNNRDLRSFEVSLETTEVLARHVPADRMLVAESGLSTPADLARLASAGARSFLIGESLMRQADVEGATRAILAEPVAPGAAP